MPRPRTFDEAAIMEAVRDTFWDAGYAGTSLDDLMAATGLGKGSLYGAFGDKRQLFLRVFKDYCANALESSCAALSGDDAGALDRLRAYLMANATSIAQHVTHRGCLLSKGVAELASKDPVIANQARETYRALEDLFTACLVQAQRHGDVALDASPRRLGALVSAVLRGNESLGRAGVEEATLCGIVETTLSLIGARQASAPLSGRQEQETTS